VGPVRATVPVLAAKRGGGGGELAESFLTGNELPWRVIAALLEKASSVL
jgi:hypothetical protein